jgi:glycosyltransferase involved in cell wall biosynthesis
MPGTHLARQKVIGVGFVRLIDGRGFSVDNQSSMRILQVSSSRTYGGGERHFVDLCRGLQDRGHEVFAALRPTCIWQGRLDFLPAGNIFHVSIRNSFGILSATRISNFVRENKIDVIHAHVARDYIPASIVCTLTADTRFVLTRHVLFPLKPFNRFALKNLSKAIAVSSGVETALLKIFPKQKVALITNGIDFNPSGDEERAEARADFRDLHGIPENVTLIGTVGELIPLKGQADFVLAANEIAKRFPETRFVIVGPDNSIEKKFRRELKRMVKVFGLEDRFLWLDWIDDTGPLFAALDIFVSASHSESFGMAILEAMTSGTPVIATDTDGARELIADEELRVPINDPVKLAAKISELLQNPEKRRSAAEESRRVAREKFSLDRMIAETEQLYLDVIP